MGGGARWYEYIGKDKKVSSLDYMHELPEN
jgi:hypothetical protein